MIYSNTASTQREHNVNKEIFFLLTIISYNALILVWFIIKIKYYTYARTLSYTAQYEPSQAADYQ